MLQIASSKPSNITIGDKSYLQSEMTNVTPTILAKIGSNLHCQPYHPLKAIKVVQLSLINLLQIELQLIKLHICSILLHSYPIQY